MRLSCRVLRVIAAFVPLCVCASDTLAQRGQGTPPAPPMAIPNAVVGGTLPEFNFDGTPPFPTPETVGTFSYMIPTGETITSATVSGQFGNTEVGSTAPVQVFVDGILVATCQADAPCTSSPQPWSFTFAASDFAQLTDGSAVVTVAQTDEFVTRLGQTTLTVTTAGPELSVTKTDSADPVGAGGALTYAVTVMNTGTATATNVILTETYPTVFAFGSSTPPPTNPSGQTDTGNNIFDLGDLAAGASAIVTITGTIANNAPSGAVTNNVTATATNAPDATGSEVTTITTPGLTITKTDSVDPVGNGGALTYTLTVTNTGMTTLTNLTVNEDYPALFVFGSATPRGDTTWDLGALAAGQSTTVTINGTVSNTAADNAVLVNRATATADGGVSVTTTENTTVTAPDAPTLLVTKTDNIDPVAPGGPLAYTVTVRNNSMAAATNVVVTEAYPTFFDFLSATPAPTSGNSIFNLGTLPAGATATLEINGTVSPSAPDGTVLTNGVTATADGASSATDTESTMVGSPGLRVTKTDSPDPVVNGGTLTYTVTVTNTGTVTADTVELTETYPASFVLVSATPRPTTGNNRWSLGSVAAGASTIVTIEGTVSPGATDGSVLTNMVTATAAGGASSTSTANTTVAAPTLTATPSTSDFGAVGLGATACRVVTIGNTGSVDLDVTGVAITGPNASEFTIQGFNPATPPDPPFTVTPGATNEVTLCFAPTSEGAKTAALDMTSNAPGTAGPSLSAIEGQPVVTNVVVANLQGNGIPAVPTVPQWTLIALGLGLALYSATWLRRRSPVA